MATYFNENISFQNSINATSLVIRGSINKILSETEGKYENGTYIFRLYEFLVKDVLFGHCNYKTVRINTIIYDSNPENAIILEENKDMVLILNRDFSLNQPENQYTITNNSYYEVSSETIKIPNYNKNKSNESYGFQKIHLSELKMEMEKKNTEKTKSIPISERRFAEKIIEKISKSAISKTHNIKIKESRINILS